MAAANKEIDSTGSLTPDVTSHDETKEVEDIEDVLQEYPQMKLFLSNQRKSYTSIYFNFFYPLNS